jgi:hypothetical protein
MFDWLTGSKKREKLLMESMMRAAGEGASRAKVNQALGTVGIQFPPENDNTLYCVRAASAIVRIITLKAGYSTDYADLDDRFVAGIFSFVVSNHVSLIVGAEFEFVAAIVPLDLFGHDFADQVDALGNSYNQMAQEGKVVEAIGQNVAKWIDKPTDEQLTKLASLFELCRRHA